MPPTPTPRYANPPIVEAVVDIDCDLAPAFNLQDVADRATAALGERYPIVKFQNVLEGEVRAEPNAKVQFVSRQAAHAIQFFQKDERQLLQFRAAGFSFNRLAPYGTLDEYLPEIEKSWGLYRAVANPVALKAIRLRYINRLPIPFANGNVELPDYLTVPPDVPPQSKLTILGFYHQTSAIEDATGHLAQVILLAEEASQDTLPIILDISVTHDVASGNVIEVSDWNSIADKIQSLRDLKNRIFHNSLTPRCSSRFHPIS